VAANLLAADVRSRLHAPLLQDERSLQGLHMAEHPPPVHPPQPCALPFYLKKE
jgi:hypothetical protein